MELTKRQDDIVAEIKDAIKNNDQDKFSHWFRILLIEFSEWFLKDVVKGLAQTLWEKSEEKHQQGKVWESKTPGECADEILDVLEQALKGD